MSEVKNKGGRPKSDEPKKRIVGLRLTEEQYSRLEAYSQKRQLTKTQVILEGLENLYSK
ncbi:hypothetical protein SAMN02910298_02261 [Pseudobutyrivibrio sp. YE44]|uniref:hypothetical protein n=1 Tax=Pseudobutyrivibrio sp. YE44 TaxID=1520802 RepID=UPI000891872D|nr:hypothetical protein [Pseudobutyrivibrio sp. YE44]SDB45197.1 hypothetical protein SAMN02910298_02261 [Pseudobutyrivibrio sp. YE44]